jgi:lipopolysaccharide heptosyltransferase I
MPLRRQPPLPSSPRRIAIIKPSALGDIVHSLPVLTALRRRFPHSTLSWIVNRVYVPLLKGHPDLDEIIPFDRHELRHNWLDGSMTYLTFLRRLRSRHFDLVLDLQCLLRTGIMALATGARCRVGLSSAREGAQLCYTHLIEDRREQDAAHAVDRYWRIAAALGSNSHERHFCVPIDPMAQEWAQEQLRGCPRPWLAAGVGARWLTKRWPPDYFAELLRRAQEQVGGTALFVGSPDEANLARQAAARLTGPVCQLAGKTTLPQMVALLAEVDVLLANDTGPLHLAVALGRPVVAPYTCTLVSATGPYGQEDRAVETAVDCQGSYLKRCPHMKCLAELTPDRLWPTLQQILIAWQHRTRQAA